MTTITIPTVATIITSTSIENSSSVAIITTTSTIITSTSSPGVVVSIEGSKGVFECYVYICSLIGNTLDKRPRCIYRIRSE